jgi:hypothetical protein
MTGNSESYFDLLGETEMNDTDNQQKRLMDIGWLAGIIEGEGCFSLQKKVNRTNTSWTPLIQITNTNQEIIQKSQRIIKDLGLACYVYVQAQKKARICYRVVTLGLKRVQRFLDVIEPHIECRKEQLECLKIWVDSRISRNRGAELNDIEKFAMDRLSRLNRPYLFSETLRLPQETEMIKSDLHGDMQLTY